MISILTSPEAGEDRSSSGTLPGYGPGKVLDAGHSRLFHGIPAAVETGAERSLIIRALLGLLAFRYAAGLLYWVEARLAYGPTVALVTVVCLLL
jgi:hypothetical protein